MNDKPSKNYFIVPHEICDSCSQPSGPRFPRFTTGNDFTRFEVQSNATPLYHDERKSVLSMLAEVRSERDCVNQEIERASRYLDELRQRQTSLDNDEQRLKTFIAPIRNLPDHLLQTIFLFCCDAEADEHGMIDAYDRASVLRAIPSVSKHWQLLSNAYSCLWSKFSIDNKSEFMRSRKPSRGTKATMNIFVQKCFENSCDAPLKIRVECLPQELGSVCLTLLSQSLNRWETVFITGSIIAAMEQVIPANPSLPSLKMFSVHGDFGGWYTNLLANAPMFTRFEIAFLNNPPYKFPGCPWSRITHLSINQCKKIDVLLQYSDCLTSLTLSGKKGTKMISQILTLPHLRRLRLRTEHTGALEHISTPALHALSIEYDEKRQALLSTFISRYANSLQELTLFNIARFPVHDLTNIKHLNVIQLTSIREVHLLESDDVFPRLETLRLGILTHYFTEAAGATRSLISMLKYRIQGQGGGNTSGSRLTSVFLEFSYGLSVYDISRLREYARSDEGKVVSYYVPELAHSLPLRS